MNIDDLKLGLPKRIASQCIDEALEEWNKLEGNQKTKKRIGGNKSVSDNISNNSYIPWNCYHLCQMTSRSTNKDATILEVTCSN